MLANADAGAVVAGADAGAVVLVLMLVLWWLNVSTGGHAGGMVAGADAGAGAGGG
jgi:hypothetical protein